MNVVSPPLAPVAAPPIAPQPALMPTNTPYAHGGQVEQHQRRGSHFAPLQPSPPGPSAYYGAAMPPPMSLDGVCLDTCQRTGIMQWSRQGTTKVIMVSTKRDTSIAVIRLKAVLTTVDLSWSSMVEALPPQLLRQHLTKDLISNLGTITTSIQSPPPRPGSKQLQAADLYIAFRTPFRHRHLLVDHRRIPIL